MFDIILSIAKNGFLKFMFCFNREEEIETIKCFKTQNFYYNSFMYTWRGAYFCRLHQKIGQKYSNYEEQLNKIENQGIVGLL